MKQYDAPHEQHAHYAGRSIRMHPENALGNDGYAPALTRRPTQAGNAPARQTEDRPQQRKSSLVDQLEDQGLVAPRVPSSSRRYVPINTREGHTRLRVQHHSAPAKRRASQDFPVQAPPPQRYLAPPRRAEATPRPYLSRYHWFAYAGSIAACFLAGCLVWHPLTSWWTTGQNDAQYGTPRTYQTDAVVGHLDGPGNPSHFLAENLNRHVLIIELEGGDPSKAISYVGPTLMGAGQDLTPVTISFEDVNHDGKPDMILHIAGSDMVFVNTGTRFRPATPADHVTL